MLRVILSILMFGGFVGECQVAHAEAVSGVLQITSSDSKTVVADRAFIKKHMIDLRIFLAKENEVCFVGDAVAAQDVISAALYDYNGYAKVLPGRVDLGIDSIQQQFQYERMGSYHSVDVKIARCKRPIPHLI